MGFGNTNTCYGGFVKDEMNDSLYIPWELILGDDYNTGPIKDLTKLMKPESKHETKLNNFWNKYCSNR